MAGLADVKAESRVCVVFESKTGDYVLVDRKRRDLVKASDVLPIHALQAATKIRTGEAVQLTGQLWAEKIADKSKRGWHVRVMHSK